MDRKQNFKNCNSDYKDKRPRIAIIYDNIRFIGGAERVLFALHEIWPEAPIFTSSVCWNALGVFEKKIRELNPKISWAQKIPLFPKYPILYRYLLPLTWKFFDLSKYDIIISSSCSQMAHLVNVPLNTLHICYSHTPPRHLYGYLTDYDWQKNSVIKLAVSILNPILRKIDYNSAQKVSYFIANSKEVSNRIKKFYGRESVIINPPCVFKIQSLRHIKRGNYFLVVSRLSRVKHIDLIIKACNSLNFALKVIGTGPEESKLKTIRGKYIQFLGKVSDDNLKILYQNCRAVICAAEDEDFGVVPVEAMSFGKPVIAYYSGGYKETVIDGKTGVFFKKLTVKSLTNAILRLSNIKIDSEECIKQAEKYSLKRFKHKIKQFVNRKYRIDQKTYILI